MAWFLLLSPLCGGYSGACLAGIRLPHMYGSCSRTAEAGESSMARHGHGTIRLLGEWKLLPRQFLSKRALESESILFIYLVVRSYSTFLYGLNPSRAGWPLGLYFIACFSGCAIH